MQVMPRPTTQVAKPLQDKLAKAKAQLIIHQPFFASILLRKKITWSEDVGTAGVTARGDIFVAPSFAESLTVQNLVFLLAHECMHYLLQHPARRGARDAGAWNIACDKTINDTLIASEMDGFIDGGVTQDGARKHSADELYKEPPTGGGGSGGDGPGGTGSDLIEGDMSDSDIKECESQARLDAAQARTAAKMVDKMPAGLERLIDEIVNVKTPWHVILERYMTGLVKADVSWARPNRRHVHAGMYLPGADKVPKMGEVVIGVDTSGSIGSKELAIFEAHVNRIMEMCRPEKVHVVYCDARVGSTEEYTTEDLPAKFTKVTGGGGTAFKPVFDWVERQGMRPDVLVYLTDMYGSFPDSAPFPTVWLSTSDVDKAPFGDVIKFDPHDA